MIEETQDGAETEGIALFPKVRDADVAFVEQVGAQDLSVTAQALLRRRARTKFGPRADSLFFTTAGLEQASRCPAAAWRAHRLAEAGVRRVADLGCGIGADALAFAAAGLDVFA